MKRFTFVIVLLAFFALGVQSQSFVFGLKGGPTLGVQTWGNSDRDPLFKYHGILFIESYREESPFSMFAQLGYHIKGSAFRSRSNSCWNIISQREETCSRTTIEYQYRNISLSLGGKKRFEQGGKNLYYLFGIRGDYTLNTNLDDLANGNFYFSGSYLGEGGVNRFNYGMLVGGGIEFELSDLVGAMIEFTIAPDFSLQYKAPAFNNAIGPIPGRPITIREQEIRNIALELTVGLSFLRKVVYVDDDY